ncbi:MAG: hypothetical protein AAFU53_11730 [Cyanobacteria bacterium J06632_3]
MQSGEMLLIEDPREAMNNRYAYSQQNRGINVFDSYLMKEAVVCAVLVVCWIVLKIVLQLLF